MIDPAVSVVVPTRNRAAVCAQTLRSILGQRDVDLEVVVVDEGSTDDTPAMLAAIGDDRVTVVRHDVARGLPAARNAGLARARGPWVAWCDDDDLWAPDKLATQLDAADTADAAWVIGGSVLVDADLHVMGHQAVPPRDEVLDRLLVSNAVPGGGSGVLASADAVRSVGGFDESLASCEDWDLWLRLAQRGAPATVDRPLVAFRTWGGSMSTKVERMRSTRREVLDRVAGLRGERGARDGTFEHERWLAKQLLRSGDRVAAAKAYASLARRHRRPALLANAVGAVVAADVLNRVGDGRARSRVPAGWIDEVEQWLAPYRTAPVPAW
ncbi:MAG TPA: glycosyltransferase [Acidimicrobiales bacterium]|nr:glycosyltransferase [Acidimicrobiales bacterium]